MKPNTPQATKDNRKPAPPPAAAVAMEPSWKPTFQWHGKVLIGIYMVLIVAYFAVSAFLKKVPPPYRLREIPKEITPWMK